MADCSWTRCTRAARKRGYCNAHYEWMRRNGKLSVREKDPVKRFWSNVDKDGPVSARSDLGPCWAWTAAKNKGYGYTLFEGRTQNAHRVSYRLLVGPVPEGLELDHLCRNRACVRPDHLEPVTSRVNLLRGEGVSAIHAAKTHCVNGHEFTPENTYEWRGTRNCKICREAATARRVRPKEPRKVLEVSCLECGVSFSYERGPGGPPRVCSDECRTERNRRKSRVWQRKKRTATEWPSPRRC